MYLNVPLAFFQGLLWADLFWGGKWGWEARASFIHMLDCLYILLASEYLSSHVFRSHSGTLALKTEDFSRKIGRFSKTQKCIY